MSLSSFSFPLVILWTSQFRRLTRGWLSSHNSGLVKGVAKAPEIAEEDIKVMFDTNVTGLINVTQAILPIFKQRPDGGAGDIIMVGSIAGREPYPGGSIYCATKAAVRSFTDALRKELISTRIRVIEIDPGQVETVCQDGRSRLDAVSCLLEMVLTRVCRSSRLSVSTETNPRLTRSTSEYQHVLAGAERIILIC